MRIVLIVTVLAWSASAHAAFKCVDEKGHTQIGDTPPPACANVTTYEINSSGGVIRKIEPPSQKAPVDTRASDQAAIEAKRRDRALLESYGSEHEIDLARDRNIEMIRGRLESAKLQYEQLDKREGELTKAIASYKGGQQAPQPVKDELERVSAQKASLGASVTRQEKDLETTKVRFEADKKRWLELKAR